MQELTFSSNTLRSWFQDGVTLLITSTTQSRAAVVRKAKRTNDLAKTFVVGVTAGLVVATATAHAVMPVRATAIALPDSATPSVTKKALIESLQKIRALPVDWTGYSTPVPEERSIVAAEQIVPALPDFVADAVAGVDGEGHVFLKFKRGEKTAYLTVEPVEMHLFLTAPGQENIYVDGERFSPRTIPTKILSVLKREFVG